MEPRAELVHWLFATGVLLLGLIMIAEAIVGEEVWRLRPWRVYLWPSIAFGLGVCMWPVMTFYTNSAIHMIAHGTWAQALMFMGGAELGLAKGKLTSRWWKLAAPIGIAVSGRRVPRARAEPVALRAGRVPAPPDRLDADRRRDLPARARGQAPLGRSSARASRSSCVALAVMLYCDRDVAPIFGHLSPLAGPPHR